jgi:D-arabinose 1-dehydrogenase-like Zn-dependent alcohol dehydrogenase
MKLVAAGKIKPLTTACKLEDLNDIFEAMEHGPGVPDRYVITKFR